MRHVNFDAFNVKIRLPTSFHWILHTLKPLYTKFYKNNMKTTCPSLLLIIWKIFSSLHGRGLTMKESNNLKMSVHMMIKNNQCSRIDHLYHSQDVPQSDQCMRNKCNFWKQTFAHAIAHISQSNDRTKTIFILMGSWQKLQQDEYV